MFKNRALVFVVLTYLLTGIYSLLYLKFPLAAKGPAQYITMFYMFIPLIATLILQKFVYKEPLKAIGFRFKWTPWYIVAALLPILFAALTLATSLLVPGVSFDPTMAAFLDKISTAIPPDQMEKARLQMESMRNFFPLIMFIQSLVAGITVNAVFAFGEEAGWRGFLLNALKGKSFYKASFLIGLIWGVWHFPVIIQGHNYPEHPLIGVFMMIGWTILLAPLFTYIALRTASIIGAAILHGVLNACGAIPLLYISGGNDLTSGITGAAGFAALIILNCALYLYDRFRTKERIINAPI